MLPNLLFVYDRETNLITYKYDSFVIFCWCCRLVMARIQGVSSKLLLASTTHFCQPTILFRRLISLVAASCKQTSCKIRFHSIYSRVYCAHVQVTTPLIQCRLRSDSTVNAVDHFVELGMPQTADDIQRLTENITTRNMNINISELVRLFLRVLQRVPYSPDLEIISF